MTIGHWLPQYVSTNNKNMGKTGLVIGKVKNVALDSSEPKKHWYPLGVAPSQ